MYRAQPPAKTRLEIPVGQRRYSPTVGLWNGSSCGH